MSWVRRIVFFSAVLFFFAYENSCAESVELMRDGKNYESLPLLVNSLSVERNRSVISHSSLMLQIRGFTRNNHGFMFDVDSRVKLSVTSRVVSGFQQNPPSSVRLKDGTQIIWGWQEGQAEVQSIAIFDEGDKLKLVGGATNIPRIFSWRSQKGLKSLEEFDALLVRRQALHIGSPMLVLFVETQSDANRYYPLAARWLQANLLGFNAQCNSPTYSESCVLADNITVPIVVRTARCSAEQMSRSSCTLLSAGSSKSELSLDMFMQ